MKIARVNRLLLVSLLFLIQSGRAEGTQQSAALSPEANAFTLVFEKETLRAEIKNKPLSDVLMELARQTDLSIEVEGSIADEKISAMFDPRPLEEGLHTLLRHKNYILLYAAPVSHSSAAYVVEGVKIAGKGNGPPFFLKERQERLRPPFSATPSPWGENAYPPDVNEPAIPPRLDKGIYFSSPVLPQNNLPGNTQTPREDAHGQNKSPFGIQREPLGPPPPSTSIAPQAPSHTTVTPPNTPNMPTTDKSPEEQIEALDDLAYAQGMAALPFLKRVTLSNPDPDVREHAQELIEDVLENEDIEKD